MYLSIAIAKLGGRRPAEGVVGRVFCSSQGTCVEEKNPMGPDLFPHQVKTLVRVCHLFHTYLKASQSLSSPLSRKMNLSGVGRQAFLFSSPGARGSRAIKAD